ncbi:MAG: protein kinase [candidate division Zixibacteria bacterium]|nr:protein kinase [candidate division Zixibacteria bacterium]
MPESNGINTWREDSRDRKADPLGIIGWALVDKYMITGYLGSGGVGDVYEGHNVSLREQRVVVKFLKRDQDAEKFQKEAKILSLLDHPNTCGIVDFFPRTEPSSFPSLTVRAASSSSSAGGPCRKRCFSRSCVPLWIHSSPAPTSLLSYIPISRLWKRGCDSRVTQW